ncbi:MAG: hypothetical protein C4296_13875 [Gemmataceae bacterium]
MTTCGPTVRLAEFTGIGYLVLATPVVVAAGELAIAGVSRGYCSTTSPLWFLKGDAETRIGIGSAFDDEGKHRLIIVKHVIWIWILLVLDTRISWIMRPVPFSPDYFHNEQLQLLGVAFTYWG